MASLVFGNKAFLYLPVHVIQMTLCASPLIVYCMATLTGIEVRHPFQLSIADTCLLPHFSLHHSRPDNESFGFGVAARCLSNFSCHKVYSVSKQIIHDYIMFPNLYLDDSTYRIVQRRQARRPRASSRRSCFCAPRLRLLASRSLEKETLYGPLVQGRHAFVKQCKPVLLDHT